MFLIFIGVVLVAWGLYLMYKNKMINLKAEKFSDKFDFSEVNNTVKGGMIVGLILIGFGTYQIIQENSVDMASAKTYVTTTEGENAVVTSDEKNKTIVVAYSDMRQSYLYYALQTSSPATQSVWSGARQDLINLSSNDTTKNVTIQLANPDDSSRHIMAAKNGKIVYDYTTDGNKDKSNN